MENNYFVHESSYVEKGANIGEGTKIWRFSHVMPGSNIGRNCVIGQNVMVGRGVNIGDRCKIQNNVSVYEGVTLEDDVFCGPSMVFTNVLNPRAHVERKDEFTTILVRKGATIGANATILGNITLGRYCFIGAGAVVKKDVPDYAVMVGVPAEHRGWACECGEIISRELEALNERALECGRCNLSYIHSGREFKRANE